MPARKRHPTQAGHSLPMLRMLGGVHVLLTVPSSIAMHIVSPDTTLTLLMYLTMIGCSIPFYSYLIEQRHDVLAILRRKPTSDNYTVDLEGKLIEPYTYAQMDISAIPTIFSVIFIGVFLITPHSEFFRAVTLWSIGLACAYHVAVYLRQRMRPKRKSVRLKHQAPDVARLVDNATVQGRIIYDEQPVDKNHTDMNEPA